MTRPEENRSTGNVCAAGVWSGGIRGACVCRGKNRVYRAISADRPFRIADFIRRFQLCSHCILHSVLSLLYDEIRYGTILNDFFLEYFRHFIVISSIGKSRQDSTAVKIDRIRSKDYSVDDGRNANILYAYVYNKQGP